MGLSTKVVPTYRLITDRLHSLLPYQVKPMIGFTDFAGEYGSSNLQYVVATDAQQQIRTDTGFGTEFNPNLGVVYPMRLFVPHDNTDSADSISGYAHTGGGGTIDCGEDNPSIVWTQTIFDSNAANVGPIKAAPWNFCQMSVSKANIASPVNDIGLVAFETLLPARTQGFTAFSYIYWPTGATDDYGNTKTPAVVYPLRWRWRMTTTSGTHFRWYTLAMLPGNRLGIAYRDTDPGDTFLSPGESSDLNGWKPLGTVPMSSARLNLLTSTPPVPQVTAAMGTTGSVVGLDVLQPASLTIEILALGGSIAVYIDSDDLPYILPNTGIAGGDPGDPYWRIDKVELLAGAGRQLDFSIHPTKFFTRIEDIETSASTHYRGADITPFYISHEQQIGFTPDPSQVIAYQNHFSPGKQHNLLDNSTGFLPPDCGATVAQDDTVGSTGQGVRYRVDFTNLEVKQLGDYDADNLDPYQPFYSDTTCAIKAVTGTAAGLTRTVDSTPEDHYPEEFNVWHEFDLSTLSIHSKADFLVNNFNGFYSNDATTTIPGWIDRYGHRGIVINLGLEGSVSTEPGGNRHFTGIANVGAEEEMTPGGQSKIRIQCEDGWLGLRVPQWNLPWMDGWNIYYAVAFLAQKGGIPPSRIAFMPYVPTIPTDPSPGLPPDQQYFLPVGPAGTPLTRHGGGQMLTQIMFKISYAIGFMLFLDVYSNLQFGKFQLTSYTNPIFGTAPPKVFTWIAGDGATLLPDGTIAGRLSEIWHGSYRTSTGEIRNSATVVGVNAQGPLWNPIVAHAQNDASVFDNDDPNFVGFIAPIVWTDNIFTDLDFANSAANSLLNFLGLKKREITLQTWWQPDRPIYPMDTIFVANPKSGAGQAAQGFPHIPFFVLGTHYVLRKGIAPRLELMGRWLPQP